MKPTPVAIHRTLAAISNHPLREPLLRLYRALVSEQAPHLLALLDAPPAMKDAA